MKPEPTVAAPREGTASVPTKSLLAPFAVGALTLLLTLYLAFQSSELHTADLALREYQDVLNEHPQEKLYQAWKMFRFEHVLNLSGRPLAELDNYQKLAESTRELGDKRRAIMDLLQDASILHIVPPIFDADWSRWRPSLMDDAHAAAPPTGNPTSGPAPSATSNEDSCIETAPSIRANANEATVPGRAELSAYMRDVDCFLKTINISAVTFNYPMLPTIYQTRNKVNLLVTWLLPGLYGLLGACVFLMRYMLQRDGATRGGGVHALNVLSIVLRIVLGGLAGIIVGWFWAPTTAASASSAISISSVSFGAAFLAGFSIEGLFSLLDRLNKNLEFAGAPGRAKGQVKKAPQHRPA